MVARIAGMGMPLLDACVLDEVVARRRRHVLGPVARPSQCDSIHFSLLSAPHREVLLYVSETDPFLSDTNERQSMG